MIKDPLAERLMDDDIMALHLVSGNYANTTVFGSFVAIAQTSGKGSAKLAKRKNRLHLSFFHSCKDFKPKQRSCAVD